MKINMFKNKPCLRLHRAYNNFFNLTFLIDLLINSDAILTREAMRLKAAVIEGIRHMEKLLG